jgi:hypothetical protein
MTLSYEQVVFAPDLYADGCQLGWGSNTTLTVTAGAVRDSSNTTDIIPSATLNLNAAVNGKNGLDTGALAASTVYHGFLIGDLQGFNAPATLLSTSSTAPVMPFGYSALRRIGRVRTDGAAHFLKFYAQGEGRQRFIQFDSPLAILTGGAATTFTAVDTLIGLAAGKTVPVYLSVTYTPTAAASVASIRPSGSSAASLSCPVELKSNVDDVAVKLPMVKIFPLPFLTSATFPCVDYLVTTGDTLTLAVAAFDECI